MLEFRNVSVSVGKTPILENISVSFPEGKITSIIGPNGCGKTTLLQTLIGSSRVTEGGIYVDGRSYLELPVRERAKTVSFMPQVREGSLSISVAGLVEHGRFAYMGFSRRMSSTDREKVELALEYTGLTEYRKCMINELSGGLQQRAFLAMQLAQDSPYMVMDEPMNYLDFTTQREMYRMIKNLCERGKTIIPVLHDINQALRISDRIVLMKDRHIEASLSTAECLKNRLIDSIFCCTVNEIELNGSNHYLVT